MRTVMFVLGLFLAIAPAMAQELGPPAPRPLGAPTRIEDVGGPTPEQIDAALAAELARCCGKPRARSTATSRSSGGEAKAEATATATVDIGAIAAEVLKQLPPDTTKAQIVDAFTRGCTNPASPVYAEIHEVGVCKRLTDLELWRGEVDLWRGGVDATLADLRVTSFWDEYNGLDWFEGDLELTGGVLHFFGEFADNAQGPKTVGNAQLAFSLGFRNPRTRHGVTFQPFVGLGGGTTESDDGDGSSFLGGGRLLLSFRVTRFSGLGVDFQIGGVSTNVLSGIFDDSSMETLEFHAGGPSIGARIVFGREMFALVARLDLPIGHLTLETDSRTRYDPNWVALGFSLGAAVRFGPTVLVCGRDLNGDGRVIDDDENPELDEVHVTRRDECPPDWGKATF